MLSGMITELYVQIYPCHVIMPVDNWTYDVIDDVIISKKNMSNFEQL